MYIYNDSTLYTRIFIFSITYEVLGLWFSVLVKINKKVIRVIRVIRDICCSSLVFEVGMGF